MLPSRWVKKRQLGTIVNFRVVKMSSFCEYCYVYLNLRQCISKELQIAMEGVTPYFYFAFFWKTMHRRGSLDNF